MINYFAARSHSKNRSKINWIAMKDWTKKKERYLHDDLPDRLSNLAVNLARITSLSDNVVNQDLVESSVEESKSFEVRSKDSLTGNR